MKIFIGADHRGFALKEQVKAWLIHEDNDVVDCGNTKLDPSDDYPDFSFAVADEVVKDSSSRGIVICGSGMGVTIAANKVKGARCCIATSVKEVAVGREHDDLNVLAISANYQFFDMIKELVTTFLATPFAGDERHTRRLNKILEREKNF